MFKNKSILWRLSIILLIVSILSLMGCQQQQLTQEEAPSEQPVAETSEESQTKPEDWTPGDVAQYIEEHGTLPDHYITKEDAKAKGWEPKEGNLAEVLPGRMIGGNVFHNREGRLPDSLNRQYYEADIGYSQGHRGAERLIYSNDGLYFYTADHYDSFEPVEVNP